jgi:hypothetical protein
MATITISLSGSAIVNGTRVYTLPDTQVNRLIAAMEHVHGDLPPTQVLAAWADDLIAKTRREVIQIEHNNAIITPLDITNA